GRARGTRHGGYNARRAQLHASISLGRRARVARGLRGRGARRVVGSEHDGRDDDDDERDDDERDAADDHGDQRQRDGRHHRDRRHHWRRRDHGYRGGPGHFVRVSGGGADRRGGEFDRGRRSHAHLHRRFPD